MPTYDGPIALPSGVTAPVVRGSPEGRALGLTTVPLPLHGGLLPAAGSAYLPAQPFLPSTAPVGLRYPIRQVRIIRKIVHVGGFETFEVTAGETLSGHRLVYLSGGEVFYASRDDLDTYTGILGLTLGAALDGETIEVQSGGEITEPSWSWISGADIFLDLNGQLTQSVPPETVGTFLLRVGVAITATTIALDIEDPILFG